MTGETPDDHGPPPPCEAELARARAEMVSTQLEQRGITDRRVLDAMEALPRHRFLPQRLASRAYRDGPLSIGHGQTISQPYMVAIMSELLALTGTERVLEIGTGSGYQTAVLARLARQVVTVERVEALSRQARETLTGLGISRVIFSVADGSVGDPQHSPYDRILVTAGAPSVPAALVDQLAEGGLMVVPVGPRHMQALLRVHKSGGRVTEERMLDCVFVPLVGQQGWDGAKSEDW